jgi:uncharacterized membrane protein
MTSAYTLLKVVHILSATVLFGTGLGTAFQMWTANKSGDVRAIATVARHIVWADYLFTTPAVIVQPLTGFILATMAGFDPMSPWLVAAYGLYVLTGLCWLPVVWIQLRMRDLAVEAAAANAPLPPRYHRLARAWFLLGWPAFSAVLAIFWLMVAKPALW